MHRRPLRIAAALVGSFVLIAGWCALVTDRAADATPAAGTISTVAGTAAPEPPMTSPISAAFAGDRMYVSTQNSVIFVRDESAGTQRVIAGTYDTAGMTGDGGPAKDARIAPGVLAVAPDGDVYFVDNNMYIRRVDATDGTLQLVAGTGANADTGDGGPAAAAGLAWVNALAFDAAGNLYLTTSESRVRRIDAATGVITTIAGDGTTGYSGDGGPATAAQLNQPSGIAVAGDTVVFSDDLNGRIRLIDLPSGTIVTLAGTGNSATGADGPCGSTDVNTVWGARLGVAPDGAIWFTENAGFVLRRLDPVTCEITTVMGDPTEDANSFPPGYGGPAADARLTWTLSAPTFAPDGDVVFGDLGRWTLLRIDATTTVVSDITAFENPNGDGGPASAAVLTQPVDLARHGNTLFVADGDAARVRAIDLTTGVITTIVGTGVPGHSGDGGPATAARIAAPFAVAARNGVLYVGDAATGRIRRVDLATGTITTYAGTGVQGDSGDGGPATAAQFTQIMGLAIAPNGDLLVADAGANRVRRIVAATGTVAAVAGTGVAGFSGDGGPAAAAELQMPYRVTVAPDDAVVIADTVNQRVRRVDPVTGVITTLAGTGVAGYNGDGGPATAAQLNYPTGLRYDAAGRLIVVDSLNCRIRRIENGTISTYAGTGNCATAGDGGPATAADLHTPVAVALDEGTHTYVLDLDGHRVRRIEGERPNLRVTVADPGPVPLGAAVALTATVSNEGTGSATGPLVVDFALPDQLTFVSAAGDPVWDCVAAGSDVQCRAAVNLAAGDSLEIALTATAATLGADDVIAIVSSDSDDADDTDQTQVLGIQVVNPATTTAPTTSTTTSTPTTTAASTTVAPGGRLPFTGSDLRWWCTVAAAAITAGGALVILRRRRPA